MGEGLSLRKHKQKPKAGLNISAPRPIVESPSFNVPQYNTHDGPPQRLERSDPSQSSLRSGPRPSNAGGESTADMVKRRMSTRNPGYLPNLNNFAPPMPNMPSIPNMYGGNEDREPEQVSAGRIKIDMRALKDPALLPEQYVASVLANADELDIMNFQAELKKLQNRTSVDLQDNFIKNRTRFIQISKEADVLKTEMKSLQSLMSELSGAIDHATAGLGDDGSAASDRDRSRRANRSSVANLEVLWSTQLQTLWKRVEGSQKYLPSIPGRHIVCESGRWVELNAATWKPKRRVHLILLNDHLLLASEKKRNDSVQNLNASTNSRRQSLYQPQQTVLVAERCWPLADVQMADVSKSDSATHATASRDERSVIANAINIRAGSESWTFSNARTSDAKAEKSSLLLAFRKAAEDLRRTKSEETNERERALGELAFLTQSDVGTASKLAGVADGATLDRSAPLVEVDGRQQNLRWFEGQIDALDMDIALHKFEEAVARQERLKKAARSMRGNDMAQTIVITKLDERAARLAGTLRRCLKEQSPGPTATKANAGWLIRLGYEELAKQEYLEARTETLRQRIRQLPFTGSLAPHLTALSYVTFTMILHTFKVYTASFPPATTSAVVKWAKDRVDGFNASLQRQLSSIPRDQAEFTECARIVTARAGMLAEVGVDFTSLVAKSLDGENPEATISSKEETQLGGAKYEDQRPKVSRNKSHGGSRSRERERRGTKDRERDKHAERGASREGSKERRHRAPR